MSELEKHLKEKAKIAKRICFRGIPNIFVHHCSVSIDFIEQVKIQCCDGKYEYWKNDYMFEMINVEGERIEVYNPKFFRLAKRLAWAYKRTFKGDYYVIKKFDASKFSFFDKLHYGCWAK